MSNYRVNGRTNGRTGRTNGKMAVALASVMLFTAACGPMNNSEVEEYRNLGGVPPDRERTPAQGVLPATVFTLNQTGFQFVEGESKTYEIRPSLLIPGASYELVCNDLDVGGLKNVGLKFQKSSDPNRKGEYDLSWAPPVGLLRDDEDSREMKVLITLRAVGENDPGALSLMQGLAPIEITIDLVKTPHKPLIEKVQLAARQINEGESVQIKVVVRDPGSSQKRFPELFQYDEYVQNKEKPALPAENLVTNLTPVPSVLGSQRYEFTLLLNTAGVSLPGRDKVVPARFLIYVQSPSGRSSLRQIVEVQVARKEGGGSAPEKKAVMNTGDKT